MYYLERHGEKKYRKRNALARVEDDVKTQVTIRQGRFIVANGFFFFSFQTITNKRLRCPQSLQLRPSPASQLGLWASA